MLDFIADAVAKVRSASDSIQTKKNKLRAGVGLGPASAKRQGTIMAWAMKKKSQQPGYAQADYEGYDY